MRELYKHIIALAFLVFLASTLKGQQANILDQYGHTSENDSILIRDYMDPEYNYLFIMYGSWCQDCRKELEDYLPYYSNWLNVFKTKVVVLDDFTFDDIEGGIDALSNYPYEVLATERIRVDLDIFDFPTNFLYRKDQTLIISNSGFTPGSQFNSYITTFLPKNPHPIFTGSIRQSLQKVDCEFVELEYSVPDITHEINGDFYFRASSNEGDVHYVRESVEDLKVYYLDTVSMEEYLLFDYDLKLCDRVSLYSTSEKRMIDAHVIDVYCEGIHFHYELNIPLTECVYFEDNLVLISGIGTNVGLFPDFDENDHHNLLQCHFVDNFPTYSSWNSGNCDEITSADDIENSHLISIVPNPVINELEIRHGFNDLEVNHIIDVSGNRVPIEYNQNSKLSVKHLAAGLYILNATIDGASLNLRFLKI